MFYSEELLIGGKKSFTPVRFDNDGIFQVPAGNKQIKVECYGGQGYTAEATGGYGGYGGYVSCILRVTPKQNLYIKVGKQNTYSSSNNASAVYTDSSSWINSCLVVAGGGGSGVYATIGYVATAIGGAGGGLVGADGNLSGTPGSILSGTKSTGGNTQTQTGGTAGTASWIGIGASGTNGGKGYGGKSSHENSVVGYGGQGYYGGGGGAYAGGIYELWTGCFGSSGAGGSSYTDSSLCTNVVHQQGVKAGNGYVIISMA